jgi:hypothetical protein
MSGRKRTLKLGWRELWPVWVVFGILIATGIVGMQVMFPPPARPKALLAGEDLTLNLADLEPAKIHLFSYPATLQNQAEFSSSAARRRAALLPSLPAGAATAPAITSKRASTCAATVTSPWSG